MLHYEEAGGLGGPRGGLHPPQHALVRHRLPGSMTKMIPSLKEEEITRRLGNSDASKVHRGSRGSR